MSLHVLLVEDDRDLRFTLKAALEAEGHAVHAAASLADARAQLVHANPPAGIDLVLLDLGLPDGDGESFLVELRRGHHMPVLVLSARDAEIPRIRLLDAGADDYLIKPFSVAELLARMRVAWRHRGRMVKPAVRQYAQAGLEVDLDKRSVRKDGQEIRLTPTEYQLLARLVRDAGRVVTHRQLLADVWGPDCVSHTHYLRLYMGQLRSKLEPCPADPVLLLTEPGVGYRLAESPDAAS